MEIPSMTTKVSPLLRAAGAGDPGRVDGGGRQRPNPDHSRVGRAVLRQHRDSVVDLDFWGSGVSAARLSGRVAGVPLARWVSFRAAGIVFALVRGR